jgi:hypothetical protein
MFKMIMSTNANTTLGMRVDRLQPYRHCPCHVSKFGISDLLDTIDMSDLNRDPVWPKRRRPEKIVNRHHHLCFLPTDIAMVLVNHHYH